MCDLKHNYFYLLPICTFLIGQTNKEFNMRHDWNSLISDDESLLIKHYTKEFFPPADLMVCISSILNSSYCFLYLILLLIL